MAGFGRIALEGEYFNQKVVNVFWYRSSAWLPLQGNPFDDVLAFMDIFLQHCKTSYLQLLTTDYTLLRAVGVGYDDSFGVVTSSPLVRTVNEAGSIAGTQTMGAAQAGIINFRCGEQHQINGVGHSKRNRGYIAIGPVGEPYVDNYSHIIPGYITFMENLANDVSDELTIVAPAVTLIPIRIHEKYASVGPIKVLTFRTYSDVNGWSVNRVASYRRSRQPEA